VDQRAEAHGELLVASDERRVVRHRPHVIPERRLEPQRLFGERGNLHGILAEMLLRVLVLGQDSHGVAEQAGGGLTPALSRVWRMTRPSNSLNTSSRTPRATAPRRSSPGSFSATAS
jgi:hypothetical protein